MTPWTPLQVNCTIIGRDSAFTEDLPQGALLVSTTGDRQTASTQHDKGPAQNPTTFPVQSSCYVVSTRENPKPDEQGAEITLKQRVITIITRNDEGMIS